MKRLLHWYGELLTDENQLQLIESSVVAATTIADVSISMIHLISCIKWANVDALFPPFQHESYNITFHIASYYYKVLGFQEHLQAAELYADPLTQMFKNFDQLWNLEDESISPALAGFCPMTPAGTLLLLFLRLMVFQVYWGMQKTSPSTLLVLPGAMLTS